MERRREARIRTDKPVELTVLGCAEASGPAQAIEFSGSGLQLVLHRPIPVNAAVKVEGEDWIMLGEVCYCRPEGIHFVAGLKIDQTLENLEELSRLNDHLLGDEPKTRPSTEEKKVLARG
ncbi:MAG TPA: PilZ domain-containing protein [Bryobacteraceae bacterium]|jgi:hypothetical protein|nr:PilZ domain-containing protein [Bryobacteraceae bacterium]